MSGWTILRFLYIDLEICQINLLRGSSYMSLPKFIERKKCCINVENFNDSKCFLYAILSRKHYNVVDENKRSDVNSYLSLTDTVITKGIKFPVTIYDIRLFEKLNDEISVNVFLLEGNKIVGPIYLTKEEKTYHVNMLLYEQYNKSHYVWIQSLSRLTRSQITKHRTTI